MTNKKIISQIRKYQKSGMAHPLTCGNNSLHQILEPEEQNGKVVLVCLDCDYVQTSIPPSAIILADAAASMAKEYKKRCKNKRRPRN